MFLRYNKIVFDSPELNTLSITKDLIDGVVGNGSGWAYIVYGIVVGHLLAQYGCGNKLLPYTEVIRDTNSIRACQFKHSFCTSSVLECYIKQGITSVLLFLKYHEKKAVNFPIQENLTLQNILQYIDQNPEEIITAESLSAKFFVSVSWIVHIFQKYLGISLMKYISKKKMLYAQHLIRAGFAPTDVAERCNFENYATFYRQYKKILNKSPKDDKR